MKYPNVHVIFIYLRDELRTSECYPPIILHTSKKGAEMGL